MALTGISLPLNSCRGFCMSEIQWGEPLSFTGNYSGRQPEVTKYNGKNYCGITNMTVVDIDLTRHTPSFHNVQIGGLIDIVTKGDIRIRNFLLKNPEDAEFNRYIRPTKNGWKIQKKRTKKSIGLIYLVAENHIEVTLL